MTFHIGNWARMSVSGNEPIITQVDPITGLILNRPGCFRKYAYFAATYTAGALTGDSQATVTVAGYFNPVSGDLQIDDLIQVFSPFDGTYVWYQVTAVTTPTNANVTITPLAANGTSITVPLTSAQILGMNAAPVLIIPAPGPGLVIQVINWQINMITAGVPTDYAGGGAIGLEYGAAVADAGPLASATIPATVFTTGTPNNLGMAGGAAAFGAASAAYVNEPIYISNATGAFTTGTSIATVTVHYFINIAF